jgi:hypothetical protein
MIPFIQDGEFKGSIEADGDCRHPNAYYNGRTCELGCCDWYECPDCKRTFLVEVPD